MTRPKVDPDKRQRTANACDSCKKRKQKCNGDKPCSTCRKRMQDRLCSYETTHSKPPDEMPPQERHLTNQHSESSEISNPSLRAPFAPDLGMSLRPRRASHPVTMCPIPLTAIHDWSNPQMPIAQALVPPGALNLIPGSELPLSSMAYLPPSDVPPQPFWPAHGQVMTDYLHQGKPPILQSRPIDPANSPSHGLMRSNVQHGLAMQPPKLPPRRQQVALKRQSTTKDDVTRKNMRQSTKGTFVAKPFWGDSSNTALLNYIKSTVRVLIGSSSFTSDPEELEVEKTGTRIRDDTKPIYLLPSPETSNFLKSSFFINASSLIHMFSDKLFDERLGECYNNSIKDQSSWRCIINLVFAIGLVMACPVHDTLDWHLLNTLTAKEGVKKAAEKFYCDALDHQDPTKDIGEARIWKIQALSLMSFFLLLVSRGREAHAYHCMSVQSAISLGLHTDDSTPFGVDRNVDEASRKNIWQSLFILDQIMAASLGRPKFIQNTKNLQLVPKDTSDILYSPRYRGSPAIRAVTRSCVFISAILERSYSGSCLLNGQFQEIARECLDWPTELDDKLRWQVEDDATAEEKSAILHVNLIYTQSVVLLSRPSFIKELHLLIERRQSLQSIHNLPITDKRSSFARVCVTQCCHSILLVRLAFEKHSLSPHHMLVINILFGSALVVFTSQLFELFPHETGVDCMQSALHIFEQYGNHNSQALRMYQVLRNFHDILMSRQRHMATNQSLSNMKDTTSLLFSTDPSTNPHLPHSAIPSALPSRRDSASLISNETGRRGYYDPMADIANAKSPVASPDQDSPEDSQKSLLGSRTSYNLGGQTMEDKPPVWDTGWSTQPNSFYSEHDLENFGSHLGLDPSLSDSFSPFASTNWGS